LNHNAPDEIIKLCQFFEPTHTILLVYLSTFLSFTLNDNMIHMVVVFEQVLYGFLAMKEQIWFPNYEDETLLAKKNNQHIRLMRTELCNSTGNEWNTTHTDVYHQIVIKHSLLTSKSKINNNYCESIFFSDSTKRKLFKEMIQILLVVFLFLAIYLCGKSKLSGCLGLGNSTSCAKMNKIPFFLSLDDDELYVHE
jgi:hypothetical protein